MTYPSLSNMTRETTEVVCFSPVRGVTDSAVPRIAVNKFWRSSSLRRPPDKYVRPLSPVMTKPSLRSNAACSPGHLRTCSQISNEAPSTSKTAEPSRNSLISAWDRQTRCATSRVASRFRKGVGGAGRESLPIRPARLRAVSIEPESAPVMISGAVPLLTLQPRGVHIGVGLACSRIVPTEHLLHLAAGCAADDPHNDSEDDCGEEEEAI